MKEILAIYITITLVGLSTQELSQNELDVLQSLQSTFNIPYWNSTADPCYEWGGVVCDVNNTAVLRLYVPWICIH
jgi:hypothetical protein